MRQRFSGVLGMAVLSASLQVDASVSLPSGDGTLSRKMLPTFSLYRPGEVTVGGEIGRRIEMTAEKLLRKIDIEKTFFCGFRERKEVPDMWGGFSGWGMALDAIVKAAAHGIGGSEMRLFKEHWVRETIRVQADDGSISMFKGSVGVWDNHEQAYLIQALCLDHRFFGWKASLAAARKLGDYLIARDTSVNLGLETAFVLLFEETGDGRYVDYCRETFAIERDNAAYDGILPVNGTLHVYTFLQRVLAQMQYRRATGRMTSAMRLAEDELIRRVFGDYCSISGSVTGGPVWGEIWTDSQIGLGKWGETCATAYLLRCMVAWMCEEPDVRYADLFERAMYNAFFGAQSSDGLRQRYFIPFDEKGEWYERETYCCPNNLRRMMFELPDAVFFRMADGFAVNLFTSAKLRTGGLSVDMETEYPADGRILISVTGERAGRMLVRVPGWTNLPDAGAWREIRYESGISRHEIFFPMDIRLIPGTKAQKGKVAVMRGPVVYGLPTPKWPGAIDTYVLDDESQLGWDGMTVTGSVVRAHLKHDRLSVRFVRFSSDSRERTYFPKREGRQGN